MAPIRPRSASPSTTTSTCATRPRSLRLELSDALDSDRRTRARRIAQEQGPDALPTRNRSREVDRRQSAVRGALRRLRQGMAPPGPRAEEAYFDAQTRERPDDVQAAAHL